jgi:deoxyinosine 3'endonuclease (endonuclease V)
MILAFDTYYFDNKAKTVCLCFEHWTDDKPTQIFEEIIEGIAEYEPGAFYKRELPCILSLLKKIDIAIVDLIVVDSFVILDDAGKLGLGGHLYEHLGKKIPIIGVAKSNFAQNTQNKKAVLRGESLNPLFVTSLGIDLEQASENIKSMHGEYRLPTLLKLLDRLTKE